jgi:hypothetical protein
MSGVIAFILAVLTSLGFAHHEPKPMCSGFVVTVANDDETPCDVVPPQRLDVTGTTFAQCQDMGGIWLPDPQGTCQGVDY